MGHRRHVVLTSMRHHQRQYDASSPRAFLVMIGTCLGYFLRLAVKVGRKSKPTQGDLVKKYFDIGIYKNSYTNKAPDKRSQS